MWGSYQSYLILFLAPEDWGVSSGWDSEAGYCTMAKALFSPWSLLVTNPAPEKGRHSRIAWEYGCISSWAFLLLILRSCSHSINTHQITDTDPQGLVQLQRDCTKFAIWSKYQLPQASQKEAVEMPESMPDVQIDFIPSSFFMNTFEWTLNGLSR